MALLLRRKITKLVERPSRSFATSAVFGGFFLYRERERYSLNFHMAREGWVARDPSRCKVTPFSLIECCRNVRTVLHGRQRGLIIVHNKVIINVIVIIATRIYIYIYIKSYPRSLRKYHDQIIVKL